MDNMIKGRKRSMTEGITIQVMNIQAIILHMGTLHQDAILHQGTLHLNIPQELTQPQPQLIQVQGILKHFEVLVQVTLFSITNSTLTLFSITNSTLTHHRLHLLCHTLLTYPPPSAPSMSYPPQGYPGPVSYSQNHQCAVYPPAVPGPGASYPVQHNQQYPYPPPAAPSMSYPPQGYPTAVPHGQNHYGHNPAKLGLGALAGAAAAAYLTHHGFHKFHKHKFHRPKFFRFKRMKFKGWK